MQLQRLTGLERQKILDELAELRAADRAAARRSSAASALLLQIIVDELRAAQTKFGDARRTEIIEDEGELSIEDLIADEDVAITVSDTGYIKRTPISTYRNQRRGGKGRIGMRTREEDVVNHLFVASTHAYMLIFTDRGRAYWLKVHEIPDVGAGRPRQVDRQPGADGGRREDRRDARGARVRRRALRRDGHAAAARSRRPSCRRSATRAPAASSPWASTTATR